MHIAMIAGEYPPRWGGIGSVVFHLAAQAGVRYSLENPSQYINSNIVIILTFNNYIS